MTKQKITGKKENSELHGGVSTTSTTARSDSTINVEYDAHIYFAQERRKIPKFRLFLSPFVISGPNTRYLVIGTERVNDIPSFFPQGQIYKDMLCITGIAKGGRKELFFKLKKQGLVVVIMKILLTGFSFRGSIFLSDDDV